MKQISYIIILINVKLFFLFLLFFVWITLYSLHLFSQYHNGFSRQFSTIFFILKKF